MNQSPVTSRRSPVDGGNTWGQAPSPGVPSAPALGWSSVRPSAARRVLPLFGLVLAIVLFMGAGDETTRFNDLGHKLMCRCSCGQVLLECNHVGCTYSDQMRGELMAGLQRGDNDQLILQSFVQKYGAVVLAAPTTTGFNRVAWIMPFVALGLGLLTVILVVRAWRGHLQPAPAGALPAEAVDAYRQRAREETEL